MDYGKAASYWEEKDKEAVHMEREPLLKEMERFIQTHNTCVLATGCVDFIRCTPIEYSYMDGRFWMLSEGGMKFQALQKNSQVCISIYDNYNGFHALGGMQVMGRADMIEPWSEEYLGLLAFKKIPEQNLRKLPHILYLIKVTPEQIDFLWSGFTKMGVASRQSVSFGH